MSKKRNKMLIAKLRNKKTPKKKLSRNQLKNQLDMVQRNVEDEFAGIDTDRYKVILEQQDLYNYLNSSIIQSLDTESSVVGSTPDPIDDTMVGFSLFNREINNPVYVPVKHKKTHLINFDYIYDYDKQLTTEQIKEVFMETDNKFIYHNAKYDERVFLNYMKYFNLDSLLWDTYLASMYLNENEPHGLKALYDKYINSGGNSSSFKDLFKNLDFSYVPIDLARLYGGKDAEITYELCEFQQRFLHPESDEVKPSLVDAGNLLLDTELPLTKVIVRMEEYGMNFDKAFAKELSIEYHEKLNKIEKKLHDFLETLDYSVLNEEKRSKLDNPVNLNSPDQLKIVFYDVMNLSHKDNNTAEQTIKDLKQVTVKEQNQFFSNLLEHRSLEKLIGTYIDKMPKVVKPDGRVHANFNQYGAKTGRFSSSDPNLQNIPKEEKKIRQMFTASEDHVLLASDFSQQEPRILAHLSQDENMIKAYKTGRDLYSWVASIVYNVDYESCTKGGENEQYRKNLKGVILGLMYGRGINSIAEGLNISYEKAQETVDKFFERFPGIKICIEKQKEFCKKHGYVKTILGRKRRLPKMQIPDFEIVNASEADEILFLNKLSNARYKKEIQDIISQAESKGLTVINNRGRKAHAERQVLNSIIQGSASDMTKRAMILIDNNKELADMRYRILLPVHDEVIGEMPKSPVANVMKAKTIIEKLMMKAGDFVCVPMEVDTDLQYRWNGEQIELK